MFNFSKKSNYFYITILWLTTILWWVVNYIYHILMFRFLEIESFGTFESLVSLFNILWVLTVGFVFFFNKEISWCIDDKKKIKSLFLSSWNMFLYIGILVYLFYLVLTIFLADFLHIIDVKLLWLVWVVLIFSFTNIPLDSLMRGLKLFVGKWFVSLLQPLCKLLFGILFVFIWWEVYGAISWFIFAWVITVIVSYYIVSRSLRDEHWVKDITLFIHNMKQQKKEIFKFVLNSVLFALFMNGDILLVKHLFDWEISWLYAAVSIIAKFLIFLLLTVETVYYSQIMEYSQEEIPYHLIWKPLVLIIIAGVSAWWINYYVGHLILWMMESSLVAWNPIFLWLLLWNTFLAWISFVSKILIWRKVSCANWILLIFIFLLFFWVFFFFRDSLEWFVIYFVSVLFFLLLALLIVLWINIYNIRSIRLLDLGGKYE